jgi:uncharacterized RDD family membrane protein YckC
MSRGHAQTKPALAPRAAEPFASVTRRSLAWVIDVAVVIVLIFVAVSVLSAIAGPAVRVHPEAAALEDVVAADRGRVVRDALLATGLSAAYFVIPWALLGGSPGQLALRIRVRAHDGGDRLSVGRALARWVLLFPPFATVSALTAGEPRLGALIWASAVVWYLVLLLTTARSDTNQGLHDRIAASVVRKRRPEAAYGVVDVR